MTAYRSGSTASTGGNAATALTLNTPAGVQPGDVIFAMVSVMGTWNVNGGAVPITTPAGWVQVDSIIANNNTSNSVQSTLFYKVVGASEPASGSWTVSNVQGRMVIGAVAYSGVNTSAPVVEKSMRAVTPITNPKVTNTITTAAPRWIVSTFSDLTNGGDWNGGDTRRVAVFTSNANIMIQDSNGSVAAGSYSKSATTTANSGTYTANIFAIQAASTPPNLITSVDPGYAIVDARGSTTGSGGALSYTITPTTNGTDSILEPLEGLFLIPQATTDKVYTITVSEAGGLTDNTPSVTVPALAIGGVERVVWDGSAWV